MHALPKYRRFTWHALHKYRGSTWHALPKYTGLRFPIPAVKPAVRVEGPDVHVKIQGHEAHRLGSEKVEELRKLFD